MRTPDRHRGKPDRTAAVMTAAMELAAEVGYAKLSIEAIATRAGVGKHTIYRRWSSKALLCLDALLDALQADLSYPDTGDVVADLRTQMNAARTLVGHAANGSLYAALVGEAQQDPALALALHDRWIEPLSQATRERLALAREHGQLRPEADPDVIIAVLYGALYYRFLLIPGGYDAGFVDAVLSTVFDGLTP